MKKVLAIMTALSLAVPCFSCEEKKNDSESTEEISLAEEISDTPEDTGASEAPVVLDKSEFIENSSGGQLRTYNYDDFKEINVPLTYTDEESPVICSGMKIPDYDFGERLSPCKKSEDPSQFDPFANIGSQQSIVLDDNGVEHDPDSAYMQLLDTPEKGIIINAKYSGGKVYYVVSYDNYCISDHEWSIYECDVETDDIKEVFRCSGQELAVVKNDSNNDKYNTWAWTQDSDKFIIFDQMSEANDNTENSLFNGITMLNTFGVWLSPVIISNKLFVCLPDDTNGEKSRIISFDLETGEEKTVYESDNKIEMQEGHDKLQISETEPIDNIRSKLTICEYDPFTDELRTITENEETKLYHTAISDLNAYITKPLDEKRCELITEKYRIKTNLSDANVLYASDKKAIIATVGGQFVMHTFDLEKMEHYITDFNGQAGQLIAYGENILFYGRSLVGKIAATLYYFIPEMGLTFTVQDDLTIDMLTTSNDTVTFTQSDMHTTFSALNGSSVMNYIKPDFIYWIEDRK